MIGAIDRATAQRFGCRSTGHATPQPSSSGPLPSNLVLAAGEKQFGKANIDRIRNAR